MLHSPLNRQLAERHHASAPLVAAISSLGRAAKRIAFELRGAGLAGLLGDAGTTSHQGEAQQKLDLHANDLICAELRFSGTTGIVASEEIEQPHLLNDTGSLAVLIDTLDGSSNIDANMPVGMIFSIYARLGSSPSADVLQPGCQQLAAGYVIFSSATVMVVATSGRVDAFTLCPYTGDFLLSLAAITTPVTSQYYSVNEGYAATWDPATQQFVAAHRIGRRGRYVGALVADFHRNLLYGGLFLYPADHSSGQPVTKLRLCYEGNPLAFIAEAAGGAGSTGRQRLLAIQPTNLHQRVAIAIGSRDDVAAYEAALRAQ
jgi:fructose-1,6-bisphosphatase I